MNEFEKLQRDPFSRRAFLQRMSAAGLGVAAVALLDGCGGGGSNNGVGVTPNTFPVHAIPGKSANARVLNYALTLEILEADLYRQALNYASGKALTTPLASSPSAYTLAVPSGGVNATAAFAYLRDFAFVEAAHRDFLTTVVESLNDNPAQRNPKGYTFGTTPAANLKAILQAILPLEETGVRAYLGAAPYFDSSFNAQTKSFIQAAVGIYSTEARHSAAIHYILGSDIGPNDPEPGTPSSTKVVLAGNTLPYSDKGLGDTFEYYSTPTQVYAAVQPLFVK